VHGNDRYRALNKKAFLQRLFNAISTALFIIKLILLVGTPNGYLSDKAAFRVEFFSLKFKLVLGYF
jgi:hypothetical protein